MRRDTNSQVDVVVILVGASPRAARAFQRELGMTMPIVIGVDSTPQGAQGVPYTVVVYQGQAIWGKTGQTSMEEIFQALSALEGG